MYHHTLNKRQLETTLFARHFIQSLRTIFGSSIRFRSLRMLQCKDSPTKYQNYLLKATTRDEAIPTKLRFMIELRTDMMWKKMNDFLNWILPITTLCHIYYPLWTPGYLLLSCYKGSSKDLSLKLLALSFQIQFLFNDLTKFFLG